MSDGLSALVTGGAGFIGGHLTEALTQSSQFRRVRVIDSLITGCKENLQPLLDKIEFIEGSLADPAVLEKALNGIDVVFHLAALPSVPRSVANPLETHFNGVHATLLLLDAARRANVRRLIYAGSSSAYGDGPELPKRESMAPAPLSPYAASKVGGEYYVRTFAGCYNMDTVVLRYFNVYGPRQVPDSPYSGAIAKFCMNFCKREPITIFGDGEQSRDFTYVSDVVQANLLAALAPDALKGQVINIARGERHSLTEIVSILEEASGYRVPLNFAPSRVADIAHTQADITRAAAVLGYKPAVMFKDGLMRTFAWYRQQFSTSKSPAAG